MLFPGRTDVNPIADAVIVWPGHKAINKHYFCANLSCTGDDLLARSASSFRNVWLVTEEATECTWLMMSPEPACPHCGSPLCAIAEEQSEATSLNLPWM